MAMATESAQERSGPKRNHWNHRGFGLVFGFVIDRLGVRRSMLLGRGPQRNLRGTPGRNRWKPTGNPLETHWKPTEFLGWFVTRFETWCALGCLLFVVLFLNANLCRGWSRNCKIAPEAAHALLCTVPFVDSHLPGWAFAELFISHLKMPRYFSITFDDGHQALGSCLMNMLFVKSICIYININIYQHLLIPTHIFMNTSFIDIHNHLYKYL